MNIREEFLIPYSEKMSENYSSTPIIKSYIVTVYLFKVQDEEAHLLGRIRKDHLLKLRVLRIKYVIESMDKV